MKRRSFLAGLLAAPLAKFLPAPKLPEPMPYVGIDMASGMDQTSIWMAEWGESFYTTTQPISVDRQVKINWLKKELNK